MTYVYNPDTEKMEKAPSKGMENLIKEFYNRLGTRIPVEWKTTETRALPSVEKEQLPSDISISDVETVLNNMKAEGWF